MHICIEAPSDYEAVESLYDLAFGPTRTLLSSYQLRTGRPVPELCLLIKDQSNLVGAVRYWPVYVQHAEKPDKRWLSLLLGPIAVHPTFQGEGIGNWLIRESLNRAQTNGWQRVFLVGDVLYYKRFGFDRISETRIRFPANTNPLRCLAKSLTPDALNNMTGHLTNF